jgi:hypothetical protein
VRKTTALAISSPRGPTLDEGTAATVEFGPHPSQYYLHTAPWSARSARCSFASLSRSTHREQATEPILAVFEHHEIHVRCTGFTFAVLERVITAHIYADLYDDEFDDIASALDALDDVRGDGR